MKTNVHLNIVDRALCFISPERALTRYRARLQLGALSAFAGGYEGGQTTRRSMLSWFSGTGSANEDQLPQRKTLISRSRDLARNNPFGAGALNLNVSKIVGTGLSMQAQPLKDIIGWSDDEAKTWKKQVEVEYKMWSDSINCDLARKQNFYEKQGITLRSCLESGDVITLLVNKKVADCPYSLRLQTIEADRLGNPGGVADSDTEIAGVRIDENGAPIAYHIYDKHPGLMGIGISGRWYTAWGDYGRRNVIHTFTQLRPEQTRGVPYLAPVIESLKQLSDYSHAELMAAVISSMFTVFISSDEEPDPDYDQDDGLMRLGNGAIVRLPPGEKADFANPSRPNTSFEPFVLSVLKQIGMALEIPYEVLIKHFSSSYSASRAALLEGWSFFKRRREWLASGYCQPIYETWLAEAVAIGRISAPGFFENPLLRFAYTRATWTGDSPGTLDPTKEVAAYGDAIDRGLITNERASMELYGESWDEISDALIQENRKKRENGMRVYGNETIEVIETNRSENEPA